MGYILEIELPEFSAAHRLTVGYCGKCNHLHGHNYRVQLGVEAVDIDPASGLVVDFSHIRTVCAEWLIAHWDHATLVSTEDTPLRTFLKKEQQKHAVLPSVNTSAECLAKHLYDTFDRIFRDQMRNWHFAWVAVWETPRAAARYIPPI
ncbi:MAG: hypothetical protein A3J38_05590 [Gammaproteobacteria bacterium RIFCSPHIGHO2_12_FULL_45_9]|nr:MAG: hypothetical protein A3J38_05590 [Gammaproteobacteria bacterium RIFCSPHIGHO2_12_FULL_45_9]